MARDLISNLSEWGLVYDEQDVRGRDVYSTDGSKLGEVKDMVADTEAEQIVALVLDNGQEYSADLVEIEDDRVIVHTSDTLSSSRETGRAPRLYSDTERGVRKGGTDDAGITDSVRTYDDNSTGSTGAGAMGAGAMGAGMAGTPGAAIGGMTTGGSSTSDYGASGSGSTAGATGSGTGSSTGMGMGGSPLGSSMGGSDLSSDDSGMLRASGGSTGTSSMGGSSMSGPMGGGTSGGYDYDAVTIGDEDSRYFREHHSDTYGSAGSDYSKMEPAYKYGYAYGRRDDFKDRDYGSVESDVRRDYETRGEGAWDDVKDAVKSGFQRARNAVTGGDDGNRGTMR